jgi:serine/threonine-protein kinase
VQIYEIDQSGGVHYIAMELAEGGDLEDLVQLSGPMEVERACSLVAEAAEALAHAHARGIIHRDVKPGNLLLTRNGRCKVCDFGLAAFDDATDSEGRAKCVGTPYYIAPEVAMAKGATAASDIYSLGCTLFFLLTGRPPYSGTSAREVMKQHIGSPLPDLRRWRPDLPDKLIGAIEQACAKDPTRRFDTAERFGKILRTFTIPTGSSGSFPHVGSDHGGSGGLTPVSGGPPPLTHGMLPPISAAQLAAIMPTPEEARRARKFQLNLNPPVVWAIAATVATALLIALGMWLVRPPKENKIAAAPSPAVTAPTGASAPTAPTGASAPTIPAMATPAGAPIAPQVAAAPAVGAPSPKPPPTPAVTDTDAASTAAQAAPPPAPAANPSEYPKATSAAGGILNGSMDALDAKGNIADWFVPERCRSQVRVLKEGSNSFLRLTSADSSTTVHVAQKIDLDPSWRTLTLSGRIRAANFKEGKNSSGVTISFRGEDDKQVGKWTQGLRVKDDSPWTDRLITADIPPGAKKLYLQCVVSYATGTIDFDDVKVVGQATGK